MEEDVFLNGFAGALGALVCIGVVLLCISLFVSFLDKLYGWANRERDMERPRRPEWSFVRDTRKDDEED